MGGTTFDKDQIKEFTDGKDPGYIELKAGGKGSGEMMGETGDLKWELSKDEKTITVKDSSAELKGSLKDDVLTLNDDKSGMEIHFKKAK